MSVAQALVAFCLSIFGTTIMVYVSMATPIGPWIAPTLTLLLLLLYRVINCPIDERVIAYQVATASIGGILATAVGFYMPTLFFADPVRFGLFLSYPLYTIVMVTTIVGISGWFGLWSARILYHTMIVNGAYPFTISYLIHGLIVAHAKIHRMYEMVIGFIGTIFFCLLQSAKVPVNIMIPTSIILIPEIRYGFVTIPTIFFDMWPMVWAIGFITGSLLLLPLTVGVISQIVIVGPLHTYFFFQIASKDFLLAFCSGMMLTSTIYGMYSSIARMARGYTATISGMYTLLNSIIVHKYTLCIEGVAVCATIGAFFFCIGLPFFAIVYTLFFGILCIYQMVGIAAKTGLAPLGRFATFVMVPAMVLFTIDAWYLTVISLFIACAGGAAVDILFSHVYVRELGGSAKKLWQYQYLGIFVGALVCGIAFLFFVTHFKLGTSVLFAYRAQTRALLLTHIYFDITILFLGMLFSIVLTKLHCDPLFVLGGILMPLQLSIGLIVGGVLSLCVTVRERYEPFWSGVFAANSIWMTIKVLFQ